MKFFLKYIKAINQLEMTSSPQPAQQLDKLVRSIAAGVLLTLPQVFAFPAAPVQADQTGICATPGQDGAPTVTGIVNSYYPGVGTVAVGATSVGVGSINLNGNTTPIAKGDLLVIIQMQDADINSTDTTAYGGNSTNATGSTNLNNAGRYEYAVASGPVAGGSIPLTKGTTNYYRTAAGITSGINAAGARSFQVVRVPQYSTATITGTLTTAAQWNGGSGGIVAVDVKGALNFSTGSAVDVNGLGFRGGGSNPNPYSGGATTTFRTTSQGSLLGVDAPKGEGIAGTPRFVARQPFGSFNVRSATTTDDLGISTGYLNGDEGRGAPANAGGGGNEHNAGGGGGANGGAGGVGGKSYADPYWGNIGTPKNDAAVGGFGGTPISADATRLIFGGGGGAGDTNDQARPSGAGGGGGGIVLIRAGSISGSGTITARGADGIDSPTAALPDAGGGGGAGGTVLVTTATGTASGLTIVATGGVGGDLDESNTNGVTKPKTETNGPGAGGGGGAVYTTGGATVYVEGGSSGVIGGGEPSNSSLKNQSGKTFSWITKNGTSNGATAGVIGINQTITASDLTTGISGSNPSCRPSKMLLVKRITAINGNRTKNPNDDTPLNRYFPTIDNPATTDDNNANWPSQYLVGEFNAGKVKPLDEIEYTIYFMNAEGASGKNVKICDRIIGSQTFVDNAYGTNQDIQYQLGANGAHNLTKGINLSEDRAQLDTTTATVAGCNSPTITGTNNGTVVINITGSGSSVQDNITAIPGATAPATANSYGYFRFKTRVKP
jgi:hypothetical protein